MHKNNAGCYNKPIMNTPDPIEHIEKVVKNIHDKAGGFTEPVLKRYPFLFGFLVVFGVAATLHGFELFTDSIDLFVRHPTILILIGALALTITGKLYQNLK